MNEKLIIRNFGPIKEANIELRDLTVFVGPQATGKSLAAQSLYFLRRYETLLKDEKSSSEAALSALEWWFGGGSAIYTNADTQLHWNPDDPADAAIHEIKWSHEGIQLSPALENKNKFPCQDLPEKAEVYIPAGRTLFSFLPPYSLMSRVLAAEEWPGYIRTFYETLGKTILWLHREAGESGNDFAHKNSFLEKRIHSIFKGKIRYTPESIMLKIPEGVLHPTNIAAGQMEIWPFWAIVKAGTLSKRFESATIYFEEPEAHLHPDAQYNVLEIISYLVNTHTRFLITTHSPYILYAINNFLMARKVLDLKRELPEKMPKEVALSQNQVSAYRFATDGNVYDIMDREIGLIDEEELDNVADKLGEVFSALQDCLEGDE